MIHFLYEVWRGVDLYLFELALIITVGVYVYFFTAARIPSVAEVLRKRNLFGIDINKTTPEERAAFAVERCFVLFKTEAATETSTLANKSKEVKDSCKEKDVKNVQKTKEENVLKVTTTNTSKQVVVLSSEEKTRIHDIQARIARKAVPESLGIFAGGVYLSVVSLLVALITATDLASDLSGPIATIAVLLLLGFVDDVLDVRWRYKVLLSAIGTIPLLLSYDGSCSVVVPPLLVQKLNLWSGANNLHHTNNNKNYPNDGWLNFSNNTICFNTYKPTSFHALVSNYSSYTNHNINNNKNYRAVHDMLGGGYSLSVIRELLQDIWNTVLQQLYQLKEVEPLSSRTSLLRLKNSLAEQYLCHAGGSNLLLYLGPLYLVYILLICIFCTNSINILAGVNGVEVGQSIVIAVASVIYNLFQLRLGYQTIRDSTTTNNTTTFNDSTKVSAIPAAALTRDLTTDHQLRALLLLIPFIAVSLALYKFNKYPAKIFVGDSYTYFAGAVLAVASVTGVYTKTLLLFFIPQLLNFFISLPQLFGIVACPRHRVPRWNPTTNKLQNSKNYTILNLILCITGDLTEAQLTRAVLWFQAICCGFGFLVRFVVASYFYDVVL